MRIDSQLCLPFSRAEHPRKPLHPCALCVVSANIPKWQNKNKIFYQTHRSYIVAIVLLKSTWKKSCEICCFSFCTQHASLLLSLLHSLLYFHTGNVASAHLPLPKPKPERSSHAPKQRTPWQPRTYENGGNAQLPGDQDARQVEQGRHFHRPDMFALHVCTLAADQYNNGWTAMNRYTPLRHRW